MSKWSRVALVGPVVVLTTVLGACGSGRNYDNPPDISPEVLNTVTVSTVVASTQPPATAFIPSTAPTTVAPPTQPPPPQPEVTSAQTPAPTPAPTSATTVPATIPERYTVVGGDSLSVIANKVGVSLAALLAANGIFESSLIVPGQELAIPEGGHPAAATTQPPATQAPATQAPATQAPATQAPATQAPATQAPATQAPAPTQSPSQATTTLPPAAGAVTPQETAASCQADDSTDGAGTPITFDPSNVNDRNPATAWRCDADTPQSITFTLPGSTHLTSVGLINGYVKTDPATGLDRYLQNHRVAQVRWTFSDGSTVTQDLADDNRSMQSIPVDVDTTTVKLEVLSTYPPEGPGPRDMVPIAEVELIAG